MKYKMKVFDYDDECIAIILVDDKAILEQLINSLKETGFMIYTYEKD